MRLYLASASPRRVELLREIGLDPVVVPHGVVEAPLANETPEAMVLRLAEAKAQDALARGGLGKPGLVLGADTAVVVDQTVLGKPSDARHAGAMLRLLRGRAHDVLTGVVLVRTDDGRAAAGVESTRVWFRALDDAALESYVASGEPLDKAGAYGIQGRGAALVERIEGSWSNVVGLPVERLAGLIERLAAQPPTSSR
jgi:septum formation protein